jgi:proteic killer suppression protein
MIRSFKHRGLQRLYERDDRSGIRRDILEIVERIMTVLDTATTPHALDIPRYRLHPLKGNLKGFGQSPCRQTGALFSALRVRMRLMLN